MKPEELKIVPKQVVCCDRGGSETVYFGEELRELLPGLTAAERVELQSSDGQIVAISGDEILSGGSWLVNIEGEYRLVIPSDTFHRRWCRNVVEINRISYPGSQEEQR